jgi:hypothetical protein
MSFKDHITRKNKNWALFHTDAFFLAFLSKKRDTNVLTEETAKKWKSSSKSKNERNEE